MSKMKSFMIPVMAVAAVASAMPAAASAQNYRPAPYAAPSAHAYQAFAARNAELERRIDRAVSQRRLDLREARQLKQELRDISRLERDLARGGLSRQERQRIEQRYDRLERNLERELRQERREDRRDDHRGSYRY